MLQQPKKVLRQRNIDAGSQKAGQLELGDMGKASMSATSSYYVPRAVLHELAKAMNKSKMVPDHVELVGGKQKATCPCTSSQDRQEGGPHNPVP